MTKKYIYIAAAVILLAVILYFIFAKKTSQPNYGNQTTSTVGETNATSTITSPTSSATKSVSTKPSSQTDLPLSATQKYIDAVRIYKNVGYYFQFKDCHAAPGYLTLKKGKKFMLDNRDGQIRKISIQGGQTFQIKPYDFAIATAPTTIGTHNITCDDGGTASIFVQQ